MKIRPLALPLIAALVVWGVMTADRASALTLVPPSMEFATQPGRTIETVIKLFNETNDPVNVISSTAPFNAKDETGVPSFDFTVVPTDLATWITAPAGPLGIQPKEQIEIPVTITVPATAEPGGHYAGLFFETAPDTNAPGQVKLKQKLGSLVILRVEGNIIERGSIRQFAVAGKKTTSALPVAFLLRVGNDGTVHFRPEGTITIKNMFGKVTASYPINPQEGAVLPDSIRRFDVSWKKNGNNNAGGNFIQMIGTEWRNFAFGSYTATAAVTYGTTKESLSSTLKVMIIPWHLLLVLVIGLTLLIIIIIWLIKRYNRMILRRAGATGSAIRPTLPH